MLGLKREGNVLERVLVKIQVVTLSEFCRIVKKGLFFLKETKRKSSLVYKGEDHGRCEELGSYIEESSGIWEATCIESIVRNWRGPPQH